MAAATGLGLDTLVEAHDAGELDRAVRLEAPVIGVNARDLATFRIDRSAQLELVARAPRDRLVVAESGIHTRAQGAAAELAGADAILVGSALMQAPDPAAKLAELVSRPLVKVCGLTREEDVAAAVDAGADLLGLRARAGQPASCGKCAPGTRLCALRRRLGRRGRRERRRARPGARARRGQGARPRRDGAPGRRGGGPAARPSVAGGGSGALGARCGDGP